VPFLTDFMAVHPDISVDLTVCAAPLLQQALLSGEVDVSIALGTTLRRGLDLHPLFADELVGRRAKRARTGRAGVSGGHGLCDRAFRDVLLCAGKGQEVECFRRPAGAVPKWVVYAGSSDAVCTDISQDFGFSILSRRAAARHEMVSSFRCLPLTSASLSADRHAVTRDDAGKDPAVSLLLDSLLGWSA